MTISLYFQFYILMQVQIRAILASLVCCLLFEISTAGRCGVSAPQRTLSELHSGCSSNSRSCHPDCVAAMHRFCGQVTYPTAMITLGVSREHINGRIGISCIQSRWSGNVPISTLQSYRSGCNAGKSQHRDCLAAIHRYCQATLGGTQFAGTSQEVPSSRALYIKCFQTPRKEHVHHNVLAARHSRCTYPNSDSDNCYAAASRWCVFLGYSGGITQEVNTNGVTVACYNAEFTNDVFVSRISDYFLAERQAAQVCSFNFDINHGAILSQTPLFLKTETYDNRASSVPLHSNFQVSKQVTETSSFTHSHSFTIGAQTTISARLPFFGGSSITLSASVTSGISLTSETRKATSYSTTSSVEVPAGEGIVKEAIVQKASISVPWTATIINGLGAAATISGQWRGISTYNFRVTQEDIDGFCPCATS